MRKKLGYKLRIFTKKVCLLDTKEAIFGPLLKC